MIEGTLLKLKCTVELSLVFLNHSSIDREISFKCVVFLP